MQNVILTQLSIQELKDLFKESMREALQERSPAEPAPSALLSFTEATHFLKIAGPTLYGYTSRRKIPFLKKGKKLYFRRSDLEDWLQSGRRKTVEEIAAEAGTFTLKNLKK